MKWVLERLGAQAVIESTLLQNLWGGYGELRRLSLRGGPIPSVMLKRVVPPVGAHRTVSDQRKSRSYEVEQAWDQAGSRRCDAECRVAQC